VVLNRVNSKGYPPARLRFEVEINGVTQNVVDFEAVELIGEREFESAADNFFNLSRLFERNLKRISLYTGTAFKEFPAIAGNVEPHVLGKASHRDEVLVIVIKRKRKVDVGGVGLVQRIEKP